MLRTILSHFFSTKPTPPPAEFPESPVYNDALSRVRDPLPANSHHYNGTASSYTKTDSVENCTLLTRKIKTLENKKSIKLRREEILERKELYKTLTEERFGDLNKEQKIFLEQQFQQTIKTNSETKKNPKLQNLGLRIKNPNEPSKY